MILRTFLDLAERLQEMGWSVVEQFEHVQAGKPMEEQNANALRMIAGFLKEAMNSGDEELEDEAKGLHSKIMKYLEEKVTSDEKGEG